MKTIKIETASIRRLAGFRSFGFFKTIRFKRVFFTSSLKLVSHFCNLTFLKTQCQAFLKTVQYFCPNCLLKILKNPTKIERRLKIINAAIQTLFRCFDNLEIDVKGVGVLAYDQGNSVRRNIQSEP